MQRVNQQRLWLMRKGESPNHAFAMTLIFDQCIGNGLTPPPKNQREKWGRRIFLSHMCIDMYQVIQSSACVPLDTKISIIESLRITCRRCLRKSIAYSTEGLALNSIRGKSRLNELQLVPGTT